MNSSGCPGSWTAKANSPSCFLTELQNLRARFGTLTGVDRAALLPLMRADKKNEGGAVRLVLSRGIGDAFLSEGVAEDVLAEFLATAA